MNYSKYQTDIFDWVASGTGNGSVNAVAGGAKTTTGVEAIRRAPRGWKIRCFAFNKTIAETLSRKLALYLNVEVSNFHQYGYELWRKKIGYINFNIFKTWNKLRLCVSDEDERNKFKYNISNVIGKLKGMGVVDIDEPLVWNIVENYDIPIRQDDRIRFLELLNDCWTLCNRDHRTIDFDDQLYFPVIHGLVEPGSYDFVLIDEFQDVNYIQTQLGLIGKRNLIVGDPDQSIYGFRGTTIDGFQEYERRLGCTKLPLSISYRCPRKVVELVQPLVPRIQPWEHAIPGNIVEVCNEDWRNIAANNVFDTIVLCRCIAPLVCSVLQYVREGKQAFIEGKEIRDSIIRIIDTVSDNCDDLGSFTTLLIEWADSRRKYMERMNIDNMTMDDSVETIKFLIAETTVKTVAGLIEKVKQVIPDRGEGIRHMTIHKSKGLEARNIFLIRPDLLPHKRARKDWQLIEERNLEYVAKTRTLENLYICEK